MKSFKRYIPIKELRDQIRSTLRPVEIRRNQPGAPPGTLISVHEAPAPTVDVLAFKADDFVEATLEDLTKLDDFLGKWPVCWINVVGLGDAEVIRQIGERLDLHKLALEDVLNVPQRPKLEAYDDKLFCIARMPRSGGQVSDGIEQVSIFIAKNFVLTVQERPGDVFAPVRQRIRSSRTRVTRLGTDYLAYAILDAIIDSYFPLLEEFGEELAEVEAIILSGVVDQTIARIYRLKRDLLTIRRAMWPQRDAIFALYREPTELVSSDTQIHLRDCADHCNHIIDLLENYREISASLVDLYLSMTSQRMNEIMKVLTVIATIFIPLTFVVGVYGMNFNPDVSPWNMPELNWRYGYAVTMGAMGTLALGMLAYFWRKGWIGGQAVVLDDVSASDRRRQL